MRESRRLITMEKLFKNKKQPSTKVIQTWNLYFRRKCISWIKDNTIKDLRQDKSSTIEPWETHLTQLSLHLGGGTPTLEVAWEMLVLTKLLVSRLFPNQISKCWRKLQYRLILRQLLSHNCPPTRIKRDRLSYPISRTLWLLESYSHQLRSSFKL